jgi:hypothetical protein
MKYIKQNWLVLTIMSLVVAMVFIRSFSRNSFRYDAARWVAASADGSNLMTPEQAAEAGDLMLLVNLGNNAEPDGQFKERSVMISPEVILEKENLKLIRKNKGPVVLTSGDASVSARVWMVLSEMGMKNIYILSGEGAEMP